MKIDIEKDTIELIENKIKNSIPSEDEKVGIKGDGNCACRSILESLRESQDYLNLRNLVSEHIDLEGVPEDIYFERNCNSLSEYTNKIKTHKK